MQIRAYTTDDHPAILSLGLLFIFTPYVIDKKFRTYTKLTIPLLVAQQTLNPKIKIYVAVNKNNQVVGFISYIIEEEFSKCVSSKCASLLFLAVGKDYQRQGVATQLLNHIEEECRQQKVHTLRVGTDEGNNAIHFYKKHGFNTTLLWEIFRVYKDELYSPMRTVQIHQQQDTDHDVYPWNVLLKRPLPWFYDDDFTKEDVHRFLITKTRNQLVKKSGSWLTATKDNRCVSVLVNRDVAREKYYEVPGTLWMLNDIFGYQGLCADFLNTILMSLPNFLMAEYWLCEDDAETKKILTDIGMKRVYGGVSLVKKL